MKRFITAALGAVLSIGGLVALAPAASAHTPAISASCSGIELNATSYDGSKANTWNVNVGGVSQSGTFGASLSKTVAVPQNGATTSWSVTIEAYNGDYSQTKSGTVGPCGTAEQHVTATPPSVSDPTCEADGTLTVPGDTPEISYSQNPGGSGPGTYTITATPKQGYVIDGPKSWTKTVLPKITTAQCDTPATPVAPAVDTITACGEEGSITFATTEGVSYALTKGDGKQGAYEVTATPEAGFTFADGTQSVFTGDLGKKSTCVTPVAPKVDSLAGCDKDGKLTLVDVEGVKYDIVEGDGLSGPFKVVATTLDGFEFADGTVTEFTGNLGDKKSCGEPVDPDGEEPETPPTPETPDTPETPSNPTTPTSNPTTSSAVLPDTGASSGTLLMVMLGMAFIAIGALTVARRGPESQNMDSSETPAAPMGALALRTQQVKAHVRSMIRAVFNVRLRGTTRQEASHSGAPARSSLLTDTQ